MPAVLALLALASLRGIGVPGQLEAIERLSGFFGFWRQTGPGGPWWPQWVTRADLRSGRSGQLRPSRNSWCYGSVGVARALQLAGLATADRARQRQAEGDLAASLTDACLRRIGEPWLCHGTAGIYQTAWRAAQQAATPELDSRLAAVAVQLSSRGSARCGEASGLLTGRTGVELALLTAQSDGRPRSEWDACLLII
jgi:hypothetical protein